MKPADIIRLRIIAVALVLAYNAIMVLIGTIEFMFTFVVSRYKDGEKGFLNLFLRFLCFFGAAFILIKNSRKIAAFIDQQ